MRKRKPFSVVAAVIVTGCFAAAPAAERTSLAAIEARLDQILANQADIQASLDALPPRDSATCADIEFTGIVFGTSATGVDLRTYTNSSLHFIGCIDGAGCPTATFFCSTDSTSEQLQFGTTSVASSGNAMRALADKDNEFGDDMTG